ncbi:MAG: fluoride efflux transporter CrcB [Saprospiraceae bacterium]|nr:fluoride efflux transporter CrcB [Saprospiraceae bacterium]
MQWLWIFIGGGTGSLCRFGLAALLAKVDADFPWATLLANGLSCIVLGMMTAFLLLKPDAPAAWKYAGMIGFCGGFSTFSTFTAENFQLLQDGQVILALTNVLVSVVLCLLCFYLGYRLVVSS